MIHRSIILAGLGALLTSTGAWAQNSTLTENINNTGIPRQAPSIALSSIYGLNPCSTGTSVGVTTPLFGVGGAVSSIDRECETRNNAAVVITGLKDEALGREILCEIKDIREAAIRLGKPCIQDHTTTRISAAEPVIPPRPALAAAQATGETTAPLPKPILAAIRSDAPAFCRIKDLDLSLYPDCSTQAAPASTVGPSGVAKPPMKAVSAPAPAKPGAAVAAAFRPRPELKFAKAAPDARSHQVGPVMLMALEQNMIHLVERRRMELAAAEHEDPASSQPRLPRGPLLAAANIAEQ
jgi:hypothetical protein